MAVKELQIADFSNGDNTSEIKKKRKEKRSETQRVVDGGKKRGESE